MYQKCVVSKNCQNGKMTHGVCICYPGFEGVSCEKCKKNDWIAIELKQLPLVKVIVIMGYIWG